MTTRCGELIHADTCGPMEEQSIGGSRYFVLFKDDYSNHRSVYFVQTKHEIKHCIEIFLNKNENITGNKVKFFRSDNGLEFVNKEVKEMFLKRGIIHQTTVPYTPQQNDKAERENRTLVEAAQTMLHDGNFPKKLWAEAMNSAVFVLNRTGKSHEIGRSPFEVWTTKNFDIHTLKVFGTEVFVHIPKERRRKWDKKAEKGMMVGYEENVKGYRIYFPERNEVEIKRDVVFLNREIREEKLQVKDGKEKEPTTSINLKEVLENNNTETDMNKPTANLDETLEMTHTSVEEDGSECYGDSEYFPCSDEDDEESLLEESSLPKEERSKRVRKQTSFFKCNNVLLNESECEPLTYTEAMKRSDASRWSEAIAKELQTLKYNNTWINCNVPLNVKPVSSKWVFRIKNVNNSLQYKARLVARGFEQQELFDLNDIYAPVAKLSTFRLFVAVATKLNMPIYQMDVTSAFLYGEIKGEVYLSLPEGAYSGTDNVVKLKKSLYGLKSSPKCWNLKFNTFITREGFVRSKCDSCFYKKYNGSDKIFLLIFCR